MANNRAAKSGLSAEAQRKIDSKWSSELAINALRWVEEKSGQPLEDSNYDGNRAGAQSYLDDGYVLGHLANFVTPNSVSSNLLKRQKMAFKKMELINLFLDCITKKGVKPEDKFQTVDLTEDVNMPQVINTICALGRKLQTDAEGYRGFGPKESCGEKRNFTEEQMKAGQNVIGLQMGSNKGATASGVNMGKGRMIVD